MSTLNLHNEVSSVVQRWSQSGITFGAAPAGESPDLERLLLDTARAMQHKARLLVMPVSWLARYGLCIAHHRLTGLIERELEDAFIPAMGIMLELTHLLTDEELFDDALDICAWRMERINPDPAPLFISQQSSKFAVIAERESSEIGERWRRWFRSFDLRTDVLRSPLWVMTHNPTFQRRIDLEGDLRCSIIETLRFDPEAGSSAVELQRRCACRSYPPVLNAIKQLELSGTIRRVREGVSKRIELIDVSDAA